MILIDWLGDVNWFIDYNWFGLICRGERGVETSDSD